MLCYLQHLQGQLLQWSFLGLLWVLKQSLCVHSSNLAKQVMVTSEPLIPPAYLLFNGSIAEQFHIVEQQRAPREQKSLFYKSHPPPQQTYWAFCDSSFYQVCTSVTFGMEFHLGISISPNNKIIQLQDHINFTYYGKYIIMNTNTKMLEKPFFIHHTRTILLL